ncbi:MAG: ABC transporter permease [Proteobacteria bacterium]|nr:MAG: ABC transporter permease [Pseudomonadota bacterium]
MRQLISAPFGKVGRLGLQALRREWRAGEVRVLALALVVAVGAVSSVGFFTDRVEKALAQRAVALLAADRVVLSRAPIDTAWIDEARRRGLRTEQVMEFRSVVMGAARPQLAEIKAVGPDYPLRGTLRASDAPYTADVPTQSPPERGTLWSEARMLGLLDVAMGDTVGVGESALRVSRILAYEPDRATGFFGIAPRVMMRIEDVAATELIQPGSRARYRLLLAGSEPELEGYRRWLEPRLADGQRFEAVSEARPQLQTALDRAGKFLGLAALVSVLLCGVAVAAAARRHAERQSDTAAVLRCLGAAQRTVLGIYAVKLAGLGVLASAVGCLLGYLGQAGIAGILGDLLGGDLPAPSWRPVGFGMAVGLVTLAGFGLPPIVRLRQVPPLRVLRRDLGAPPLSALGLYGLGALALAGLMLWISRDPPLTIWLLAGTAGTLLLLGGGAWLLVRLLAPLRKRVGVALRFGLAGIARRPADSVVQVMAFGVGIMALLLLSVVRNDLLDVWQQRVPPEAPNHFLINIPPSQVGAVTEWFGEQGIVGVSLHAMSHARLDSINGADAGAWQGLNEHGRHWLQQGFNLSWAEQPQQDNRIISGRWWRGDELTQSLLSVEQRMAENLGIGLGDRLVFRVADQPVELTVANIRSVEWDNFRVNFFLVTTPSALADLPATYVTSVYLPPDRKGVLTDLVRNFPSITVFDVEAILNQVRSVIGQVVKAVEFVFLFTLVAGVVVLYAALQSSLEERLQEGAVLRALGAKRGQLRLGLLGEYVTLGLLAGLLAAFAAALVGLVLADQVLDLAYRPEVLLAVWGALLGGVGVGLAGLWGSGSVLRQSPMAVLRQL